MSQNEIKMRARESVQRFKNGSPTIKDVIRKKCKERWKRNREDFIDKLRHIREEDEMYDTLTSIIKEDLKSICLHETAVENVPSNFDMLPESQDDSQEAELLWLLGMYDNIFEDEDRLAEMLDELNQIICPICQKNTLEVGTNISSDLMIVCRCGLSVKTNVDLHQVKENILTYVNCHNSTCNMNPEFNVINDDGNHVYLTCHACLSFFILF